MQQQHQVVLEVLIQQLDVQSSAVNLTAADKNYKYIHRLWIKWKMQLEGTSKSIPPTSIMSVFS